MKKLCIGISLLLLFLPGFTQNTPNPDSRYTYVQGAIIRGDSLEKKVALVFSADEFAEGGDFVDSVLAAEKIKASFFLTGNFLKNPAFTSLIRSLQAHGNYIGSHSDAHLLYNDWSVRDSMLVTREEFKEDLTRSYQKLEKFGITKDDAHYFLPPYEWYNDTIAAWTESMGLQLIDFTPGTRSNADYTYPAMGKKYVASQTIFNSILKYESDHAHGLNGFILLTHMGAGPQRTDKFFRKLPALIHELKNRGYQFCRVDELLRPSNKSK